jgi:hypothetical protein
MSNEEHLEEILHKAHENGFYNELLNKVHQIQKDNPMMGVYEKFDLAYAQVKNEKLQNDKNSSGY